MKKYKNCPRHSDNKTIRWCSCSIIQYECSKNPAHHSVYVTNRVTSTAYYGIGLIGHEDRPDTDKREILRIECAICGSPSKELSNDERYYI